MLHFFCEFQLLNTGWPYEKLVLVNCDFKGMSHQGVDIGKVMADFQYQQVANDVSTIIGGNLGDALTQRSDVAILGAIGKDQKCNSIVAVDEANGPYLYLNNDNEISNYYHTFLASPTKSTVVMATQVLATGFCVKRGEVRFQVLEPGLVEIYRDRSRPGRPWRGARENYDLEDLYIILGKIQGNIASIQLLEKKEQAGSQFKPVLTAKITALNKLVEVLLASIMFETLQEGDSLITYVYAWIDNQEMREAIDARVTSLTSLFGSIGKSDTRAFVDSLIEYIAKNKSQLPKIQNLDRCRIPSMFLDIYDGILQQSKQPGFQSLTTIGLEDAVPLFFEDSLSPSQPAAAAALSSEELPAIAAASAINGGVRSFSYSATATMIRGGRIFAARDDVSSDDAETLELITLTQTQNQI